MRTILVGANGTPASLAAVEWTAQIAKLTQDRVVAVHVVPTLWEWEMAALQVNADPLIRSRRRDLNARWTAPLRRAGVPHTVRLREGDPGKQLLAMAKAEDADLIVIGGKPHRRVHELVFGGTRHQLITKATAPVVVVPVRSRERSSRAPGPSVPSVLSGPAPTP